MDLKSLLDTKYSLFMQSGKVNPHKKDQQIVSAKTKSTSDIIKPKSFTEIIQLFKTKILLLNLFSMEALSILLIILTYFILFG